MSALNSLSHLLAVSLDDNKLTSVDVPSNLPYLQTASFASNRVQSLAHVSHPLLESLNLNCKNCFDDINVYSNHLDISGIFEVLWEGYGMGIFSIRLGGLGSVVSYTVGYAADPG